MQIYDWQQLTTTQQHTLLCRPVAKQTSLTTQVSAIIRQVAEQGDAALLALTERYDGIRPESLQVSAQTIAQAQQALPQQLIAAIDQAAAQIRRFHAAQQAQDITLETLPGVRCELRHEPLARVGLYIPGGSAPLISTVLMLGIPAQLAGCYQRMLMTPPPVPLPFSMRHPNVASSRFTLVVVPKLLRRWHWGQKAYLKSIKFSARVMLG